MQFLFSIVFLTIFSINSYATHEICFVGATPNFFKAGHAAIRSIATRFPAAHMRLALISQVKTTPPIVKDLEETKKLSFHTWPLGDYRKVKSSALLDQDMTAEMEGLVNFFRGCTAAFLVPPIDGRVDIGSKYARAVSLAKVPYAVVLGVQYSSRSYWEKYSEKPPQIAKDAEELYEAMDQIFLEYNSPIKYIVFHLPMFLENILYQTERLRDHKSFYWPVNRNAQFAYISSKDLGRLVAHALVEFEDLLLKNPRCINKDNPRRCDITTNGGITSAAELEKNFKDLVDNNIKYKEQTRLSFVQELKDYLAKSDDGANTIAELYDEIGKGRDLLYLDTTLVDLGYPKAQSARNWIKEHKECFQKNGRCIFPLPPSDHQAPPPRENDAVQNSLN